MPVTSAGHQDGAVPAFTAPDGTELAYHLRGEGEPLLVLPGDTMRACAYLGDLGGRSSRRRLIMLDPRGTGDSAVPADPATYRVDRQVADVEAFREHLGLEHRADVLAHSAGGDLALLHAARHPRRVRNLSLITARARPGCRIHRGASPRSRGPARGRTLVRDRVQGLRSHLGGRSHRRRLRRLALFFYGRWDGAARAHTATDAEQSNYGAADRHADTGAFDSAEALDALAGWDARVLVLPDGLDGGPLPRVAGLLPPAEPVVQPGAGHFPRLDGPRCFTGIVETFLQG
ncbi:alpha/beta hydrolase [Streptomyces sp. NPDC004728]|uniref:alpha/beta fold hydrolase n=1 Tax=Streptomyces sp. NPDC004728 TaxID=3154289 RepID=UPI0033BA264A